MAFLKLSPEDIRKHKGVSFTGITTVFWCHDGSSLFLAKRSKNARDEHGETLEDNVRRELKEEYGVDPLRINFIGYRDVFRELEDGTATHWLAMDFAVQIDRRKIRIAEPDMFDDFGWFSLDALPSPLHSQFDAFMRLHGSKLKEYMNPGSAAQVTTLRLK